ncbi:MAG: hypothetical protein SO152_01300 [Ruminococcus sp.]|nr:hypothetical protein [Ruminococcus sp.]
MDKELNRLQREEAGKRLEILGYPKDVCEKYIDKSFLLKLQEADSGDVPEEINIAPFLKMEEDENIFTYLYRYSVTDEGKLQLRLFFVTDKVGEWEKDREILRSAMEEGIDSNDAKTIFRTFVRPM